MLALITGFYFLLIISLTPAQAKAKTHSVIIQSTDLVSVIVAELTNVKANVSKTIQGNHSLYENGCFTWNVGFLWTDKFFWPDGSLGIDVLEELASINV